MSATEPTQQKIADLVQNNEVLLFMKGTAMFPQCGFSSTVAGILKETGVKFETVNVLADEGIRSGIKIFSDWPTIPQLYIKGEFVGGCDITKQLAATGELHTMLGVPFHTAEPPIITVTEAAASVLGDAAKDEGMNTLRFQISRDFQYGLSFGPEQPGDLKVASGGLVFLFDNDSAKRADGLSLDYRAEARGFHIENPNEPASVQQLSVAQLKAAMDADPELVLVDVRTAEEQQMATIAGAQLLDRGLAARLESADKSKPLYFICHTGGRSQQAAGAYLRKGFAEVYNVTGGIDAWSASIDSSIPRY